MKPHLPEHALVEIPAHARSQFDGDRFSYLAAGDPDAQVVLLLHGSGASAPYWRHQFAALSSQFRLVAWNAPGYALSDTLHNPAPSYEDYADALSAFCNAHGIGSACLVGNSFGASGRGGPARGSGLPCCDASFQDTAPPRMKTGDGRPDTQAQTPRHKQ